MVQTLMIIARKVLLLEDYITLEHIESMNKVILVTGTIVGVAYLALFGWRLLPAARLPALLDSRVTVAGKTGTTNDRRDSWFVGYTRNRVAVAWVGEDDNRPAGVTGSNAAMHVWAGLFRQLPLEAVDLRMPDGAYWLWVDRASGRLSAESCADAVQLPFVEGSEPLEKTSCLAAAEEDDKESIWRKLFGKKNQY